MGTKFAIYDSQPPYRGAVAFSGRSSRRFYSRKVSPKLPSGSYGIAHIAYELNMLGTRGPRRMRCTMHSIPASSIEPNGFVPTHSDVPMESLEDSFSHLSFHQSGLLESSITEDLKSIGSSRFYSSTRFTEVAVDVWGKEAPLVLKNKAPRWHEQLQCWCLNFRGRVTVASVKNFQLIASSAESVDNNNNNSNNQNVNNNNHQNNNHVNNTTPATAGSSQTSSNDHDKVILQFGKIGKDLFTMDYRYPLSAFQAFAICLSSFDTKLACE